MKFRKIASGIRVYVNLEEEALIELLEASKSKRLYKTELTEKQSLLGNQLVNKSILRRRKDDKGLYYTLHDQTQ